jgi:hypothetical protein
MIERIMRAANDAEISFIHPSLRLPKFFILVLNRLRRS